MPFYSCLMLPLYSYSLSRLHSSQSTWSPLPQFPSSSCSCIFRDIMCTYGKATIIWRSCTRANQHKTEKHMHKRCDKSPKPSPACSNATHNSSLDAQFPSQRGGPCKRCKDSGASVDTVNIVRVKPTVHSLNSDVY